MDDRTLDDNRALNDNRARNRRQRTGDAKDKLMRQEQNLSRAKVNLRSATRNSIVGGVILLIGVFALIQFNVAVGVVVLLIGGWVFVKALAEIVQERRLIETITDKVTNASHAA